jgi:2-keto-3-deoxy-L-rhamnonate aldolase RhmA
MIIPNRTKRLMQDGGIALGLGLRHSRTVDIAQVGAACGFDWLFIDCEHSAMNIETAAQISVASLGFGITPVVRVPGFEHHHATRALDNGAQGIVFPHVDDGAQAEAIAGLTHFPPEGHRSIGGPQPQLNHAALPVAQTMALVNQETLVVAMIESAQGIAQSEAIAAVPGIDVLFIGTNDLCAELGIPGQFGDAKVEHAYASVVSACKRHGKFAGMGGVYSAELMQKYINMGVQFVLAGTELSFLMTGAKDRIGMIRGFTAKT